MTIRTILATPTLLGAVALCGCGSGAREHPAAPPASPTASAAGAPTMQLATGHKPARARHRPPAATHHAQVHHAGPARHARPGPAATPAPAPRRPVIHRSHVVRAGGLTARDRHTFAAVRTTLRTLVTHVNRHDTSVCTQLYTLHALEETTGFQGRAAIARCRKDIGNTKGPHVRINKIEGVRVVGDKALIQFTSSAGRFAKRQILRLLLIDGRWRIDGDGTADATKG